MKTSSRWATGVWLLLGCAAPACILQSESVSGPGAWEDVDEGIAYVDGNVGIHTLAPEHALEVDGDVKAARYRIGEQAFVGENGPENLAFHAGGKPRLTVKADGTVLVSESEAANDLQVTGNAFVGSLEIAGACTGLCTSDGRLKKNVAPLGDALARLLRLRGVTFEWKDEASRPARDRGVQTGFVAQEVEAVFPEWVVEGGDGYKRVHVRGFEALAVEALRSVHERAGALAARVTALEEANRRLAAEARAAREASARVADLAADLAAERAARAKLEARLAALEAAAFKAR